MAAEIDLLDLSRFFEKHPLLETERLILRKVTVLDAPDLHEYFSDPETAVYVPHAALKEIKKTEAILARNEQYIQSQESFRFAVVLKQGEKVIGTIDLHNISLADRRMEIGYGLTRAYWGKGHMTEVVREVIRFAFEEMGFHRIEAECETGNLRACRIAEHCGMTLEATRRENEINKGRFVSNHVYAIVRS